MAFGYLVLAVVLATTLNHPNRWLRAGGSLLAALALVMMITSIVLANLDGTFTARGQAQGVSDRLVPWVLNAQAAVATAVALLLCWAAWRQLARVPAPIPLRNGAGAYGRLSRHLHWLTAVLVLCLIPIGLFTTVLPSAHPERAAFVASHQSLGLTVALLLALRLLWLLRSPGPDPAPGQAPWERRLAAVTRAVLYLLLFAFPLSGLLLNDGRGDAVQFFGLPLPSLFGVDSEWVVLWDRLHGSVLPVLFYLALAGHTLAVLKHHFIDGRREDVRRMLT